MPRPDEGRASLSDGRLQGQPGAGKTLSGGDPQWMPWAGERWQDHPLPHGPGTTRSQAELHELGVPQSSE